MITFFMEKKIKTLSAYTHQNILLTTMRTFVVLRICCFSRTTKRTNKLPTIPTKTMMAKMTGTKMEMSVSKVNCLHATSCPAKNCSKVEFSSFWLVELLYKVASSILVNWHISVTSMNAMMLRINRSLKFLTPGFVDDPRKYEAVLTIRRGVGRKRDFSYTQRALQPRKKPLIWLHAVMKNDFRLLAFLSCKMHNYWGQILRPWSWPQSFWRK